MLRNVGVTDGFRRKKYSARKRREPLRYAHVHDPVGRTFLLYVSFMGEQLVGGHVDGVNMTRRFKEAGITDKVLHAAVVAKLPAYPAYYAEKAGRELTPNTTMQRWRMKATYTNGKAGQGGTPAQSREHYTASPRLRPYVARVEAAFRSGAVLTLEQMRELGT
jgi:hypothetical protein